VYRLTEVRDDRGSLVAGEVPAQVPFTPVRFFLVSGVPAGSSRGGHAHRRCHQYLVAAAGTVEVEWEDGSSRETVTLGSPGRGLHLPPLTWASERYVSPDAVLMVLASEAYDRSEYVEDHDEFVRLIRG
jgi:UDP-2-acetamido-3-amino-2,3-dideoxy-glucuronate N-acetyltransferase